MLEKLESSSEGVAETTSDSALSIDQSRQGQLVFCTSVRHIYAQMMVQDPACRIQSAKAQSCAGIIAQPSRRAFLRGARMTL